LESEQTVRKLFEEIARQRGIEAGVLASRFNMTKSWVSKKVADLKALDLVESQERRKGYWLTEKGVAYVKAKKQTGEAESEDQVGVILTQENLDAVRSYSWRQDEEGHLSARHTGLIEHLKERGFKDPARLIQHLIGEYWRSKNTWWLEPHPTKLDTIKLMGR
jgi:DNA-binding MarR family transcriptional regulator